MITRINSHLSFTKYLGLILPFILAAIMLVFQFKSVEGTGELTVEIIAGHNLVVDSNVKSPSTYGPEVATVIGKFCNKGLTELSNVYGYIGNFSSGTPGDYPAFDSATLPTGHALKDSGLYFFTHMGGSSGQADGARMIGNLAPGSCNVQYWHIVYPQCEGMTAAPCSGEAVWGLPSDPNDDLSLQFDMWAKADNGIVAAPKSFWMKLRNEISAMANKIEPNPDGMWFNTKSSTVRPGEIITSNGVNYELGNVNKGFDNDGDGVYDFNAWMQPIGRQTFDPNCFRLIRTTGVLTVSRSGGNPPMILNFRDQLYFSHLPPDNTGVKGNIFYTFMAMGGPCNVDLSPYQEVASGADNEKFNADFGAGIPPVTTFEPDVTITKASDPNIITLNTVYTYTIPFANVGTGSAGLFLSSEGISMPLVIRDTVPAGVQYLGNSASCSINGAPTCDAAILFSTNSGVDWSTLDPGTVESTALNKVVIQWRLNAPLPAQKTGYARFKAQVSGTYSGPAFIENSACASFGGGASFRCGTTTTLLEGSLSIGERVYRDENNNGSYENGTESGFRTYFSPSIGTRTTMIS